MRTSAEKNNKPTSKYWDCGIGKIYVKGKQRNGLPSYFIRFYNEQGKRISRKAKGASTLKEAKVILLKQVKEIERLKDLNAGKKVDITLENLKTELVEKKLVPNDDVKTYNYSISNFIPPDTVISSITTSKIDDYRAWMLERGNCKKTINLRLATLKKWLQKADERGYRLNNYENPVRKSHSFTMPKNPPKKRRSINPSERERLLAACRPHIYPIVFIALETGMRWDEILNLKWVEVTLDKGNGGIILSEDRTKDKERRYIPFSLNAELYPLFKRIKEQTSKIKDNEFLSKQDREYVFLYYKQIEKGLFKWVHPTTIRRSFNSALKKAGLDGVDSKGRKVSFHSLRHTFITNWIREQRGSETILRKITGHNSVKVQKGYEHLEDIDLSEIVEKANGNGNGRNMEEVILEWYQSNPENFKKSLQKLLYMGKIDDCGAIV